MAFRGIRTEMVAFSGQAFFAHYRPHYWQAQGGWARIFAFLERTVGPGGAPA